MSKNWEAESKLEALLVDKRKRGNPSRLQRYLEPEALKLDPGLAKRPEPGSLEYIMMPEADLALSEKAMAPSTAPAAVSPPGVAVANPATITTPSSPAAPTAANANAATGSVAAPVSNVLAAAVDRAGRSAPTTFHTTYADPAQADKKLVNVYTLRFYEHWNPALPDDNDTVLVVDLPFVQRVTMQAPNAVSRTRSIAGQVYAEHAGFVQRTFVVEGRSGPVWNADADAPDALTISRFTKMRNVIEAYARISTENKNALVRYKDSRLSFFATFESEEHFCDIVNFNYRRSTESSTYSFEYTITLVTNGVKSSRYDYKKLIDASQAVNWTRPDNGFIKVARRSDEAYLEWMFKVGNRDSWNAVRSLPARAAEGDFAATNLIGKMSCSSLSDLRLATSLASATLDNAAFTQEIPGRALQSLRTTLGASSYVLDLAHKYKGTSGIACPTPAWSDLYYSILPAGTEAAALIRFFASLGGFKGYDDTYRVIYEPPVRPAFDFGPATPEGPFTAVNYFMRQNSADAYTAAEDALGNRNEYWRIIEMNNMRDAYTRGDGTPLVPGASLLVPAPLVPAVKDNDVLGTDLLLVDGDLKLVGNNDIMRISGYGCYSQNLVHRMKTPRGSNKVFPRYGLSPFLHTSAGSTVPALIRADVRDQILQDHRTEELTNLVLTELGDKVHLSMLVRPIAAAQHRFEFNYNLNNEVTP